MSAGTDVTQIRAEHATVVDLPPLAVYELITDVALWPVIFGPTVHTRVLETSAAGDRFEIWATLSNGDVNTWRSRRTFDIGRRHVTFAQDHGDTLFGSMSGGWTCVPLEDKRTRVVLEHRYHPRPDQAGARQRIARELDHNGSAELEALRTVADLPGGVDRWLLTFSESLELAAPVSAARDFIWDAGRWPERLPHVAGLDLVEGPGGTQDMTMRTKAPDGSEHVTRSVRVLLSDGSIVYKQTRPPQALLGHSGRWEFLTGEAGSRIRSTHTFLLDPDAASGPPDSPLAPGSAAAAGEAKARIRAALSANSQITMEHAARYATSIGATR